MKRKNKKGQNEIVGFVAIILVVAVIGVILLSLTIGKGGTIKDESAEISDFLSASMYHTTDCAVNFVPQYKNIEEIIKSCYKSSSEKCFDNRNVCEVLISEFKKIVDSSLEVSEERANKGYKMKIIYRDFDLGIEDEIMHAIEGGKFENCKSKIRAGHTLAVGSFSSGVIDVELEVCRG